MPPEQKTRLASELNRQNELLEDISELLNAITGHSNSIGISRGRVGVVAEDSKAGANVSTVFDTVSGEQSIDGKVTQDVEEGDSVVVTSVDSGVPKLRPALDVEEVSGIGISGTRVRTDHTSQAATESIDDVNTDKDSSTLNAAVLNLGKFRTNVDVLIDLSAINGDIVVQGSTDQTTWFFIEERTSGNLSDIERVALDVPDNYVRVFAKQGFSNSDINRIEIRAGGL